ncbi:IS110 family transposase [Planktomarina sp.]|jgi:transposase|nr:IS110 family transposase [Planktomarina sp.]
MTNDTIGVDISKATLDVHRLSDGLTAHFKNNKSGFLKLKYWLSDTQVTRIVYEPTGAYHRDFEMSLGVTYPMVKVNPLHARRFAQARGVRAKTDRVDAQMLAIMGDSFSLEPQLLASKKQRALKELQTLRMALLKDRTRNLNRQKPLKLAISKRQIQAYLNLIERQLKDVNASIQKLLSDDPTMACARDILCSIPELSKVSAAALLIEMPELGTLSNKQAASLAGLAPMSRQSGKWNGKAFIQGGRKHLRNALYMPALVAARHNPDLKAKYTAFVAAGKPKKVALSALMRKLIILANILIKQDRKWCENMT